MFDGLADFGHAWLGLHEPDVARATSWASRCVGIIIGSLPGLSATMGIALMTTLTIKLPSNQALLVLICTYVGAIYGGSRTAILLNIPGTPANAASCLDGYALAQQGRPAARWASRPRARSLGTLFGMFCLPLFTPVLGEVALKFGAYEFFWLALFGVIMSGTHRRRRSAQGLADGRRSACSSPQIGQEGIYAYDRFTFGKRRSGRRHRAGPALVGAFGFAEVLTALADPVEKKISPCGLGAAELSRGRSSTGAPSCAPA